MFKRFTFFLMVDTMSLSLAQFSKAGPYDAPASVTIAKKSSVSMAAYTSCFCGISMWLCCNVTSFVSFYGDHVKDHPTRLKRIFFFCHSDVYYFVYIVHSVNSTLTKEQICFCLGFHYLPHPSTTPSENSLNPAWITVKGISLQWVPCGLRSST